MTASDRLHARVGAFIERSLDPHRETDGGDASPIGESFDELALDIARFQARSVPPMTRLVAARAVDLGAVREASEIPAIPCDVFRLARVAAHPPEQDTRVFRTSGTTLEARGEHPFRTLGTYVRAACGWAQALLWPDQCPTRCIALVPSPLEAADSSLSFMIDEFAKHLGAPMTWHVRRGSIDAVGLAAACAEARAHSEPALLMGTSFAFVHLLDRTTTSIDLRLPPGSRIMQTGGFKGRSREVSSGPLRQAIAARFEVPQSHVVGEYGMTELSSQLYEPTVAGWAPDPALAAAAADRGVIYRAPPWMRVTAVDPETLLSADGIGIARIVDLANVDSAVAIQTADSVLVRGQDVLLFGRAEGAPPRGCSLAAAESVATS